MAGVKKTPERLCLGCQMVRPKKELVRIVRSPEGVFSVDLTGRKPECFDAAVKRRQFAKSFQGPVDADVLKTLRDELFPEGT